MLNKNSLRNTLLIASTLAALATGTGMAAAQVADNPPGSAFQDQGIREDNGQPRFGEEHQGARGAYGYVTRRTTVAPNGRDARHHRDRSDYQAD
jgi:hypothetical protein